MMFSGLVSVPQQMEHQPSALPLLSLWDHEGEWWVNGWAKGGSSELDCHVF